MGINANNRDMRLGRIYCDGAKHRQDNGGLSKTDNPYAEPAQQQEHNAWDQGWDDRNAGTVDQSMCGYPVAGAGSPELSEVRY